MPGLSSLWMVRAVVFDVGETLLDDTREYAAWADWLGVPRHTFSAVLGAVTAGGRDNAETFQYFRPSFDLEYERSVREAAGWGQQVAEGDLYADARPALAKLGALGLWLGVAGNQPARVAGQLRDLGLPVDAVVTSGELGVAKPDPRFFARVVEMAAPAPAAEIVYVGDHRDHDIIPAKAAGLRAALIRRGPWGHLWADDVQARGAADWCVDSLRELADLLAGYVGR